MIYKSRALNFAFRKLGLNPIYNAYSNGSPFKYYISILGGSEAMLIELFRERDWGFQDFAKYVLSLCKVSQSFGL